MADQTVNRTAQMMYENALNHLSNGILSPIDQNVLSYTPLPGTVIDPYISQDVDALETMNLTNNALNAWIEESKKASYFTKHFVTLSRMIMSGVATMARGLVTLHMKGEDLDQAPMSIGDLISVSSYQFRKSYLGVLQTVKKNPQLSEDLLLNQLGWNNTLIKLFKTRDKLSQRVHIQQKDQCLEAEAAAPAVPELCSGTEIVLSADNSGSDAGAMELKELPALSEPGSYGAIRAYAPYGRSRGTGAGSRAHENRNQLNGKEENTGNGNEDNGLEREPVLKEKTDPEDVSSGEKNENAEFEIRNEKYEEGRMTHEEKTETGSQSPESSGSLPVSSGMKNQEEIMKSGKNESGKMEIEDVNPEQTAGVGVQPLDPEHPPEFFKILYRALCRGSGTEDGSAVYTVEEVHTLLADPEFCYYKPELAAEMRKFLETIAEEM